MKGVYRSASPYKDDALSLPVGNVDAATPFYEQVMGFEVIERTELPHRRVVLKRDDIEIGLSENGGDPTQEGCFFRVDDVEIAFNELKANGLQKDDARFEVCRYGDKSFKQFFVVAPDGLCFCIGQLIQENLHR